VTVGPRWVLGPPPSPGEVEALGRELDLPPSLCAVLAVRGLGNPDDARRHLRPLLDHLHPPAALAGIDVAAERVRAAIRRGETILVHGDYDVDGVCAAALYTRFLRRLGARVEAFVPHRLRDGYDVGRAGLRRAEEVGASLLLTADCGTVAHEALRRAADAGLDVVVTDHHTPGGTLPPAVAVVNPNRRDCAYPEKGLCGAGVAFKLCSLLASDAGLSLEDLVWYLDLVAVATVADLVPLEGENRVLTRFGLRVLRQTRNPGLRALLAVCGLTGTEVGAGQVGFVLGPRINAAGRVGDADEALRLLLTDDPARAEELAEGLEDHNRRRQEEDRRTLDEAVELLERDFDPRTDHAVVLASEGWHPGVIGIVASRVVERVHRPTVLVALEGAKGRGSARSIPGFDLYEAVAACAPHLERFGGHRQAAGMDLRRDAVPAFRRAFLAAAARRLEASELLVPRLGIDLELPLEEMSLALADILRHLGPHGIGNPRPVFLARDLQIAGAPRTVGKGHLKLRLARDGALLQAIGFGMAERLAATAKEGESVDAVFQLQVNEYRGRRTPQARLLDLRPTGEVFPGRASATAPGRASADAPETASSTASA
jgi:single-stranded-DNA-specific exonuclease